MASKVFFTDFRTTHDQSLTVKLKKLIRRAGIDSIDFEGKFVAIKMHFGEPGNLAFLRPNYARAVVDVVKEQYGKAADIIRENRRKLDEIAQYLYERETITGEEFMKILLKKDE